MHQCQDAYTKTGTLTSISCHTNINLRCITGSNVEAKSFEYTRISSWLSSRERFQDLKLTNHKRRVICLTSSKLKASCHQKLSSREWKGSGHISLLLSDKPIWSWPGVNRAGGSGRVWTQPPAPCSNPATRLGGWATYFPPLCLSVFIYKMSHTVVIRTTKSLETLRAHSKCHMPLGWSCLHPAMSFEDDLNIWDTVDWFLQFAFKGKSYLISDSLGLFSETSFAAFQVWHWKYWFTFPFLILSLNQLDVANFFPSPENLSKDDSLKILPGSGNTGHHFMGTPRPWYGSWCFSLGLPWQLRW